MKKRVKAAESSIGIQNSRYTEGGKMTSQNAVNCPFNYLIRGTTFVSTEKKRDIMQAIQQKGNALHLELDRLILTVRVVFGMRSLDCQRLGICKMIETDDTDDALLLQSAVARLTIENGYLRLQFLKKTITEQDKYRFTHPVFSIGENLELPDTLSARYGLKNVILLRGSYPIEKRETAYMITINWTTIEQVVGIKVQQKHRCPMVQSLK